MNRSLLLVLSGLLLLQACEKDKPSYAQSLDRKGHRTLQKLTESAGSEAQTGAAKTLMPENPLLSTEPNCKDAENREPGHSPGPGINHCATDRVDPDAGLDQRTGGR